MARVKNEKKKLDFWQIAKWNSYLLKNRRSKKISTVQKNW
jgi:hypothetical protein